MLLMTDDFSTSRCLVVGKKRDVYNFIIYIIVILDFLTLFIRNLDYAVW
jgi:hypothetical protein